MPALSVFIITKNEEDRIGRVIAAIKKISPTVLDEILVIDSGSVDKTEEIATSLGAKFIFNEWRGYGPQKVFGEQQCRNNWILNIDADEEISPELAEEISAIFSQDLGQNVYGYRIKIVNQFPLEKKPKKLAYYYNQLRIYNRNFAGFKDSTVHDSVELKHEYQNNFYGKISQLNHIVYHQSFRSCAHWIEKINAYSEMQAQNDFKKGKYPSPTKVFLTPVLAFLKAYFLRRYFIYGSYGIVYSYIFALGRLAKATKTRELFRRSIGQ